jgi:cell division protease FtsH
MSDLSSRNESAKDDQPPDGWWHVLKKATSRLCDWFVVQSLSIRILALALAVLTPALGSYSLLMWRKHSLVADEVRQMSDASGPESVWSLARSSPVVFGAGSLVGFVERHPVDRITVIYRPLLWNVSERFVLVESGGRQHAFYPSDLETQIFSQRAVTAAWGGKLNFVPREALSAESLALVALRAPAHRPKKTAGKPV